jgi:hypothetical protein
MAETPGYVGMLRKSTIDPSPCLSSTLWLSAEQSYHPISESKSHCIVVSFKLSAPQQRVVCIRLRARKKHLRKIRVLFIFSMIVSDLTASLYDILDICE